MSGVDAVRGFNYQHCHALLVALDVAVDDTMAGIRVEGTDDVLDLEVHAASPSGGAGVVVRGVQVKSRQHPYTWAQAALLEVVRRWAALSFSSTSEFEFRTDGELGPTGVAVRDALDAARGGDLTQIAALLGVSVGDPLCAVMARASVVSEPGSVEALLLSAEQEVRARLVIGPGHPDADRQAEDRVNELFTLISTRSGLSEPDDRFISRQEIVDVLGGVSQLMTADRWAEGLGAEYVAAAVSEDLASVIVPKLRTDSRASSLTIADLAGLKGTVVLSGRTGSGKSTLGRLWCAEAAATGGRVVVCQAEGYVPERLDRLVADAVGDRVGRALPRVVGQRVLGDLDATIVIDGVSEIPAHARAELAKELQVHLSGGHGARLVLMGRDESVCASALPASMTADRLYPESFGHEQRLELTANVLGVAPGEESGDAAEGGGHESDRQECRVALGQVEHALGDAAGNPMLLRMALQLVAGGTAFTDRASVYELTVARMAERRNVADIRIATAALGIVFSELLDDGRRYANPLEWARLFNGAGEKLKAVGVVETADEVREAIERSGLVTAVTTGESGRVRVPVHDSFADYFAARAHADGLVALPTTLVENDENRVLLSAQMTMFDTNQSMAVAHQRPFTMVRLSEFDHTAFGDDAPEIVAALLNAFLPDATAVNVTMWRGKDGSPIAQAGTPATGWVETADAPAFYGGPTAVAEPADGPVTLAVRLWRLILKQRLRRDARLRPKAPKSREEGAAQLADHAEHTVSAGEVILLEVAPPSAVDRLAQTVGPFGMTGVVYQRQSSGVRLDYWPVRFRRTVDIDVSASPDDEPPSDVTADGFSTGGDVESHLSTSPERTAAKQISDAIIKLTRPHWL